MALKAGTKQDMTGSMAAAIERAFLLEWPSVMGDAPVPSTPSPEMRLLFVAIAQGVIRHIRDNPGSFLVDVDAGNHSGAGRVTAVQTTGTLYS